MFAFNGLVVLAGMTAGMAAAAGQTSVMVDECFNEVLPYERATQRNEADGRLDLGSPAGGRLVYVGAQHSTDPEHAQFAEMDEAWTRMKPTLALFEGPDRGIGTTREETIRRLGESGYVRFLAKQAGTRTASLEPNPADEVRYLVERFGAEQVGLFFALREAARLRERQGMDETQIKAAIGQLLQRAAKMMPEFAGDLASLEDLEAAYRRHWSVPENWWQAPTDWFDPGRSSAETGGKFTNEINRASSHFRDRHMARVLSAAVLQGETVFAVVGRDHVPMQAPALRCALGASPPAGR